MSAVSEWDYGLRRSPLYTMLDKSVLLLNRQKRPPIRGMQEALHTCGGKEEAHGRDTRCRCHALSTSDYTG
jgi:hypothetical protein